eukprot:g3286.t1
MAAIVGAADVEMDKNASVQGQAKEKEKEMEKEKEKEKVKVDAKGGEVKLPPAARLVMQRCDRAELLLDNDAQWASMGHGIICYVSFSKSAAEKDIPSIVKYILKSPVLHNENAKWGDGSKPRALVDLADAEGWKLMVVPQAGLFSKLKGKYLQYRSVCEKQRGLELYTLLCEKLREALDGKPKKNDKPTVPLSTLTKDIFKTGLFGEFAEFDTETGMPTVDKAGQPVGKKKLKKLARIAAAHDKKRNAALASGNGTLPEAIEEHAAAKNVPESTSSRLIAGTYGNRQGMKIEAECGPFFHVFEV